MNRRKTPTKTSEQLKIALVLCELEKGIKNFRLTIEKKGKQLNKFSEILKVTKIEHQKKFKENKNLKNYILKQQQQQQQQK